MEITMFVLRFLVLAILTFVSWDIGQSVHHLNAMGNAVSFLILITAPALYMLPTFEAWKNKQPNLVSIALVNVFLGWSLIGWVVALAWAFKSPSPNIVVLPTNVETETEKTKKCLYCAEDILAAAVKCKHCGSDLSA
jgi:hypothetical protein